MNKKKITKQGMFTRMDLKLDHIPTSHAIDAIECFTEIIVEELAKGHSVTIPNVGVLHPTIKEATERKVVDAIRQIPERLTVRFAASKYLQNEFRSKHSKDASKQKSIRSLGDNFLKK